LDSTSASYSRIPLAGLINAQSAVIGGCMVTQIPGPAAPSPTGLAAGTVNISGPVGNRTLLSQALGFHSLTYSPGFFPTPGTIVDGTLVTAGDYTFTATGGADVGAHNASINHPAAFVWNEFDTVAGNISRGQALTVTWTGGSAGGTVSVSGQSQSGTGIGAVFFCLADASAGTFTVPAFIMSALPPTISQEGFPLGSLNVTHFRGDAINVPGLDQAAISIADSYSVSPVNYQ
jgi:hypothetical protein